MNIDPRLHTITSNQPYPLLFASLSGAHLYGFPSLDSDFDLRGAHILPLENVVGLYPVKDVVEAMELKDGLDLDLVTYDVAKFFNMLLRPNGYVLEQLFSPLVVCEMPECQELRAIAKNCVTRLHAHHYLGFAATQWHLFDKEDNHRVKPLLYVYRVLLTGIHLMRSGEIEANLATLVDEFHLAYLVELIDRKRSGIEKATLPQADLDFYRKEFNRLVQELEKARDETHLPLKTEVKPALNDLLVRIRLNGR